VSSSTNDSTARTTTAHGAAPDGAAAGAAARTAAALDVAALARALAGAVGESHVIVDPDECRYYSRDLFPWDDSPVAVAVVAPGTTAEVQAVARTAAEFDADLVVRGGGMSTGRSYVPATRRSVIVDMRRLDRVREVNPTDRYVIVEAGCTWERLHAELPREWTIETHTPLSGNYSTVGGAIAHGFPGGLKGVLGVEVVGADGGVFTTGSWGRVNGRPWYREYGPDLTGLFVGDTGAMGIKTAVALHLVAPARARASASFGFDRFEDVAATFVELAPLDVLKTRFCFDPYDTATLAANVKTGEAAGALQKVVRSASSVKQGLKDGLSLIKAGLAGPGESCWSINLVAEQFTQAAADAAIAEAAKICLKRGREITNVLALVSSTPIYSVRRFLGRDGERWIATHAIFPIGDAVEVVRRTERFFADRAADLDRHRIRVGYISQVTPVHFQIEPLFYWPDALEDLHFRHLAADEAARFRSLDGPAETRDYVRRLRSDLRDLFEEMGSLHVHASKFFRYAELLQPGTRAVLERVKDVLDPDRRMNPGNLGLAPRSRDAW
jgi:D-lactate dehydrogenase (cytochrome)